MTENAYNPQLADGPYSPLDQLIREALTWYGDFTVGAVQGDVGMFFIRLANRVIDDVRMHAYWPTSKALPYYTALPDIREVPDPVIVDGILAHYSKQQMAREKMQVYFPQYSKTLNQHLWHQLNGNTPIQIRPRDRGTGERPYQDPLNGSPTLEIKPRS